MTLETMAATTAHRDAFTTVIIDSIGADTVAGRVPHFAPEEYADSVRFTLFASDVATSASQAIATSDNSTAYTGKPVNPFPSGGTPLVGLLVGLMIATALSGGALLHAVKVYRSNLVSVRRRNNAIDGIGRVPFLLSALLALNFVVFGGTALYLALQSPASATFGGALRSMGIVGAYSIFQLLVYNLIGYSFSTPGGHRRWLEGFEASQAFGGLLLIAPTLLMMCMPQWHAAMAVWCAAVYILSRIFFIVKGFRIFYPQMRSLLFFILYLLCLEILPPVVVIAAVRALT